MPNNLIYLNPDYLGYLWLVIAVIFLFTEIGTPGLFFFIAFAVGSCFAGLLAFLGYSFMAQCVSGLVVSMLSFFVLRYFFVTKSKDKIETNFEALIGKNGIVVSPIKSNSFGQVKVGGEIWSAKTKENMSLEKGTVVIVVEVKGNRLIVKC